MQIIKIDAKKCAISNENSDQEKALFRLYAIEKTDIKSADKR